jgi:hypothetical protein
MTNEQMLLAAVTSLVSVLLANHGGWWVSGREYKAISEDRDFYRRLALRAIAANRALVNAAVDTDDDEGSDDRTGRVA